MRRRPLLAGVLALACAAPGPVRAAKPVPILTTGTTTRASVGAHGAQTYGDDGSYMSATSPDGRYVAFTSWASGLTSRCPDPHAQPGVHHGIRGIYLRDLKIGTTEILTASRHNCPTVMGAPDLTDKSALSISANGRCVAFTGFVDGDTPFNHPAGMEVWVRDRVARRTILASRGYDGWPGNADSSDPAISADCSTVAFKSEAVNLLPDQWKTRKWTGPTDIFVRDLRTGRLERVGPNIRADGWVKFAPSLSGNGRYVTFVCAKPGLAKTTPGPNTVLDAHWLSGGPNELYVYDRVTRKLEMASVNDRGEAANDSVEFESPADRAISADGRYVTYASLATNLVPGDDPVWTAIGHDPFGDKTMDVYRYDRVAHHVTLVSAGPGGIPGDARSWEPSISADGRWIAYTSAANNLGDVDLLSVPLDSQPIEPSNDNPSAGYDVYLYNAVTAVGYDVYLYDAVTGTNRLISRSTDGIQGDRYSFQPFVNANGTVVSYTSRADNLVNDDTNGLLDVFVYQRAQS
jgi:Tol biopolymer transport system component